MMAGMVQTYELMAIVRPDLDVTEANARELVEKLLDKSGAVIASVALWGKKQFAFPVNKYSEGTYLLAVVNGTLKTADLEKQARMGTDIVRFMLTEKK
jgi:small subunit ribosomal protein S6